jgi:hypothetical protein
VSPRCLSSTAESTFVFKYQARRPENIIHSSIEKPAFHERDTYKWWVLITVSLGSLTLALDNSILATCLPRLANAFHTDSSVIAWVNLTYFVMSQSLMLTLGKIGDAKGRKKVFIAGLSFSKKDGFYCRLSGNNTGRDSYRLCGGAYIPGPGTPSKKSEIERDFKYIPNGA